MAIKKYYILILFVVIFLFGGIFTVSAADNNVTISPLIIDEKAKARDILEYKIKIKNNSQAKVELYPFVNDVKKEEGKQEFINPQDLSKETSLARWMEISRGVVEIGPNEEKEIPLKVKVNLSAAPGKYYAVITFSHGPNRVEAEKSSEESSQPQLFFNLEIEENIIERAEVNFFKAEKSIYLGKEVNFVLGVKNIGNRDIAPKGSIIIYDRKGREIGNLDINKEGEKIKPEEKKDIALTWDSGGRKGRFKAKLEIEYGGDNKRDLQDAVYFSLIPKKFLILFSALLVILIASLPILIIRMLHHHKMHYYNKNKGGEAVINLRDKKN